jgi:phenylalanyl-tRNA synthetase beta chain
MKVTINWLKEYVDLDGLPVEELAEGLTMAGLEVEAVVPIGRELQDVVAGKILEVGRHPRADRLTVCRVDCGKEVLDLVCGAPNVREGVTVPVALPGAILPSGIEVKPAVIRGVSSPGMICSERELGLSEDHSGIMILKEEIVPGTSLSRALNLEDTLLEISVTPNRGDCLSHIGIAREISALFRRPFRLPDTSAAPKGGQAEAMTSVTILAPELCPRYVARLVTGVRIGPSPAWLRNRLLSVGIRSINNVVDITNFVLMELGQPLHAFDFDTLAGQRIVVRRAEAGERLITLDDQERELTPEMLVIADAEKGVALAGIMGGLNTEIRESTRRILIESAAFDPRSIRRTAKKLGLTSEASLRFERGVDIEGALRAADRAALLIRDLAGGEIVPGWVDVYPGRKDPQPITWNSRRTSRFLGIPVTAEDLADISRRLGFKIVEQGEEKLKVVPPSFRPDLTRPVDLMEEAARLVGYEKIPVTIPKISSTARKDPPLVPLRRRIREVLTGIGFHEVITYSFISEAQNGLIQGTAFSGKGSCLTIRNPISEDQAVMRTSLIPGLLLTMQRNWSHRNLDVRIFEIGTVFFPQGADALPKERNSLGILWTGRRYPASHHVKNEKADFFDIKGVMDHLASALRIADYDLRKEEAPKYWVPESYVQVYGGDLLLGEMGEIAPAVRSALELKEPCFVIELDLEALLGRVVEIPRFQPWPRYPEVTRDMALILDESIPWKAVQQEILSQSVPWLEGIELFDVYVGRPIPEGKKNLGVRIHYRSPERTLSDEEVNRVHEGLLKHLLERFEASLRER